MSVQLRLPGWSNRSFIAEIVTLPATVKLPIPRAQTVSQLVLGFIFSLVGYVFFKMSGGLSLHGIIGLALGSFGALTLAKGIFAPGKRVEMTFDDDFVTVTRKGWIRAESWREPLTNYEGLALRRKETPSRPKASPYQIIELVHKDSTKTLPLFAARRESQPIDHLDHYADVLGVDIIK